MIITISGVPGSGKTSAAKLLAEKLGMKFYSMGGLRGKMALERGITIAELNALGEKEEFTDKSVDDYQKELGQKEDGFVIEGRLSWYFIPRSFKILILCDPKEGARRVFEAQRASAHEQNDEPLYHSLKDAEQQLAKRVDSDSVRYKKYYGLSHYLDPVHYDLVIDTTHNRGPNETVEQILKKLPHSI